MHVVIAMRSEFLGRASAYHGLPEAIDQGQYLIPRLSREQLRRAIDPPVRVADGAIEESLVQRLLNELGNDQDQLPVLQHALMRTWQSGRGAGAPASSTMTATRRAGCSTRRFRTTHLRFSRRQQRPWARTVNESSNASFSRCVKRTSTEDSRDAQRPWGSSARSSNAIGRHSRRPSSRFAGGRSFARHRRNRSWRATVFAGLGAGRRVARGAAETVDDIEALDRSG